MELCAHSCDCFWCGTGAVLPCGASIDYGILKRLCMQTGKPFFVEMIKRKAIEIYCRMLLGNRAFPQISDVRSDMRQRALFATIIAACRGNRMLLARENVDSPLAAIAVATEHNARCASRCQPPGVDKGTSSRLNRVPAAWSIPAYLKTLAVHAAFNRSVIGDFYESISGKRLITQWCSPRTVRGT